MAESLVGAMQRKELLKLLKDSGVKSATFSGDGTMLSVEFFPSFPALDVDSIVPSERATEPPPAPSEDGPPNVPPAMARILTKGSVS